MGVFSSQQQLRWTIIVLAFIVLRTVFALVWDVSNVGAVKDCSPFANEIYQQDGTNGVGLSKCEPDGQFDTVGNKPNSFLIMDMGIGNEIVDDQGVDFYYYEKPIDPGVELDWAEIAVAQDDGTNNPGIFTVVFIWGDENPDNNGAIPSSYNPEIPNEPIIAADLHNNTGIGINIGNDDGAKYRFVRFQTHPIDAMPPANQLVEVDAVEGIHPTPTPTETPTPAEIPTDTPTIEVPTDTPTSNELPTDTPTFEVPTDTPTSTELPTDTSTPEIPTEIPTRRPRPTKTPTNTPFPYTPPTASPASTATYTPTNTATATFTPTSTFTATLTSTFTQTSTATLTLAATHTPTNTLTAPYTPTVTPTPWCPFDLDCRGISTNLISTVIEWIAVSLLLMGIAYLMTRSKWFNGLIRWFIEVRTIPPSDTLSDKSSGQDDPSDKSIPEGTEEVGEVPVNQESDGDMLTIFTIIGVIVGFLLSIIGIIVGFFLSNNSSNKRQKKKN